jgi:dienelactone hydrolase
MPRHFLALVLCLFASLSFPAARSPAQETAEVLPGTATLDWEGDITSRLVDGVDRFLLGELEASIGAREKHWSRDRSSPEAYAASLEPQRKRLAHILGVRDERVAFDAPSLIGTVDQPPVIGIGKNYVVMKVRWPAIGDMHGEGLLLLPANVSERATVDAKASVIAIPDADQTPEQLVGLIEGIPAESQYARRLAESGCRVLVPTLIDRRLEKRNGRANLTRREFLYRSAFEMGRHLIGYELQKVLAGVDWFSKDAGDAPIGVMGWGEGGLLSLYAAALDPRIDACGVSGYFDSRQDIWQEPIDRNVFGLLQMFGDAELASMIAPRTLVVEAARGPELTLPSEGGAPARLLTPKVEVVRTEVERAKSLAGADFAASLLLVETPEGRGAFGSPAMLEPFLKSLSLEVGEAGEMPAASAPADDNAARQARQMHEIDRHSQALLSESHYVRQDYMKGLDTSSLEKYVASAEPYREHFAKEVIGRFEKQPMSANPRSRKKYDEEKWTGYEVVLDVFPDVIAYGVLLLPKNIKPGEKRPVVVCQHGLEGRPEHVIAGDVAAYHDFAAKLAERGFITFAPQNLYIFQDRFRTLQRKANPIKKTLFSVIVPQHQQIVDWLSTLPEVDPSRIAFYGLSYGGKSAMRIPPLVPQYCLSICSADFNEWVWKNVSSRAPYSYIWTGEYEIFEFDLGSTFNYAEMAALIAPRPFMVERGHFDGVAPDETVAYEFAKVRFLYAARLGIADRCEIEWFVGPHTINGKGTFDFLHKHLDWPKP